MRVDPFVQQDDHDGEAAIEGEPTCDDQSTVRRHCCNGLAAMRHSHPGLPKHFARHVASEQRWITSQGR